MLYGTPALRVKPGIGDILIDNEMILIINFINLKIKITQSFIYIYRVMVYVYVFIRISTHI
jgi:hypothetical protein